MLIPSKTGDLVQIGGFGTRYKVTSPDTHGAAAVVEHSLEAGLLGAPMHRHEREDEISYVIAGELTVQIGRAIHIAGVGDAILKPRGIFHTFWNAGSNQVCFLEVITPGGFEVYFRELRALIREDLEPDFPAIAALADRYGLEFDYDTVPELMERHGVRFG